MLKQKWLLLKQASVGIRNNNSFNAKPLDIQGTQGQLFSVTDNLSGSIFAVADISGVPIFDVNSSGVSYFDGDVGIGTNSPNRQLSIYGTNDGYMSFDGGRTGNHEFVVGSEASGFIIYDDTLDTYRFVIDQDSGNVGIGTDSPGAKLEVFGTGNSLRLDSAANGSKEILFRNVGTGTATIKTDGDLKLFVEDAGKNILLVPLAVKKMRILANGNVGIGTTNPEYGLSVLTDDGGGVGNIVATTTRLMPLVLAVELIPFGGYYNATQITPWAIIRAPKDTGGNGNFAGALTFSTRNSTSFNEAMRISSAGAIKFNAYGAGTLVTDASGNITAFKWWWCWWSFLTVSRKHRCDSYVAI